MSTAIGWVLFGFGVWALSILVHAFQQRVAPDMDAGCDRSGDYTGGEGEARHGGGQRAGTRDREIRELRERVEVLEAIVTDRRYQFDEALVDRDESRGQSSARGV